MEYVFRILDIVKQYRYLGERQLEDGTLLIGRAPHIAPHAWLHSIYPPLKKLEIEELESKMSSIIPNDYKEFLEVSNGLKVFNTTFSLDGLRKNFKRGIDDVWQPFSIITPNTLERPENSRKSFFFIGGYDWDGYLLYIDSDTNKVHLCNGENATSLFHWKNFEAMLESEINRLIKLFDKEGRELNPEASTLPI